MLLPYLKKFTNVGNIGVWIVDGNYIRNNMDIAFTNFGQHYCYPKLIPTNEFWLDKDNDEEEYPFFIDHLIQEHRLMAGGMSYDKALKIADRKERAERVKSEKTSDKGHMKKGKPEKTELRKLFDLTPDGEGVQEVVEVWLVDGAYVRTHIYVDFTEGGHDLVYRFIPKNHIWLDNALNGNEWKPVLLHEGVERNLMSTGMKYSQAHALANKAESKYRENSQ